MESQTETKFNKIVDEFRREARKVLEEALDESLNAIHSEMLPYVTADTESNAIYRAADIVKSIISGNIEIDGDKVKVNQDGFYFVMTNYEYDSVVDNLAKVAGDRAKDLKIERLEARIKELLDVSRF